MLDAARSKARRGELRIPVPIGFIRDPSGVVTKDPDMAVQERLGLVFEMFLKFRTVAKSCVCSTIVVSIFHAATGMVICVGRERRSARWRRS